MAAEDRVTFEVAVDGADKAAASLDKVTRSLELQKKLSEGREQLQARLQMEARIRGYREEADKINAVTQAQQRMTQQSAAATVAATKFGEASNQMRAKSAAAAALVGNLGNSLQVLVPGMDVARTSVMSMGMGFSQFLGVLGGGPGVLLGGAIAALGLVATYMASTKREADELAKAVADNAKALGSYMEQIAKARASVAQSMSAFDDEVALQKRLRDGDATSKDYRVEIAAQREAIRQRYTADRLELQRKVGGQSAIDDMLNRMDDETKAVDKLEASYREAAAAARQLELAKEGDASALKSIDLELELMREGEKKKSGKTPRQQAADLAGGAGSLLGEDFQSTQEMADALGGVERGMLDYKMQLRAEDLKNEKEHRLQLAAEYNIGLEDYVGAEAARIEANEARKKSGLAVEKALTQASQQTQSIMMSTAMRTLSEVVKGHKLQAGAFFEALGDQMVAEGTRVLFQATAMEFIPGMQGPGAALYAVGLAEIAAGLAMGAAGARGSGGSTTLQRQSDGAGKGGSGGGGGGSALDGNFANPMWPSGNQAPQGGGATNIYISMPTVTSPTAEDGARVRMALGQASRQYGPSGQAGKW